MTIADLKIKIDTFIKANGNREITGPILNDILKDVIDTLDEYSITFYSQISEPIGTSIGDIWYKPSTYECYRYDGNNWNLLNLTFATFDHVLFQQSPSTPITYGQLQWDPDNKTLSFGVLDGSIQIGQETFDYYINASGGTIVDGDAVSIVGTIGNTISVSLTDAMDPISATQCIGLATTTALNGEELRVTKTGAVNNLNTSGYIDGAPIYVDPLNVGKLTSTKPNAPYYTIKVGYCAIHSETFGRIDTKVMIFPTFKDLSDVNGTPLIETGQIPMWHDDTKVFDFDYNLLKTFSETKSLNGFIDGSNIDIFYNYANRTITLTGNLTYYWRGVRKTLTSPWTSSPHIDAENRYFLYSTDGDNFNWSSNVWTYNDIQVTLVIRRTTIERTGAIRETHGLMDGDAHAEFHSQVGTYRVSGGNATAGTYILNTATDAATTPGFDSAVIKDEDLTTSIAALIEGSYLTMSFDSFGLSVITPTHPYPFHAPNNYIQYNNTTLGTMVDGQNNRYYNVYQYLVPTTSDVGSQRFRNTFIQPQREHVTLEAAQTEDTRSLNLGVLGTLATEYLAYARLTYLGASGDTNYGKCRLMSITYVVGSRIGQVNISGFVPSSHSALSNLTWSSSGHNGTPNTFASFDGSGLTTYVATNTVAYLTGAQFTGNLSTTGYLGAGVPASYKLHVYENRLNEISALITNVNPNGYGVSIEGGDSVRYTLLLSDFDSNPAARFYGDGKATFLNEVTATRFIGRIKPTVQSITSSATISPNCDTHDVVDITALAVAITTINAPTGTPQNKQRLLIDIKDNGVARAISGWNAIYAYGGASLPNTTLAGKQMSLLFMYDVTSAKWKLRSVAQE